ncbi:MAG: phosphoribosylaminoimidazolesuccinocarboxamide synthase [Verrucomicrobiales bacterium]|jgi:phosphoribosylaminoimidazole-succinocarboxamide synthase|nr:phosphoribosylaminoimidazolesuccinocarboxamide synthase [Verrucomicrobiales bacterium]
MAELKLIHQGKVREVYSFGDYILLVATDRISAFDVVLPNPIPGKGVVLTQLARFWFERLPLRVPSHAVAFAVPAGLERPEWRGRVTVCRRARTVPMECIVRGYLSGSGWSDYQRTGAVQGVKLPAGLSESARLPEPIFTPTTKAAAGHDEPLTVGEAEALAGVELYARLKELSLGIYRWAHEFALQRGIIIADTKFEFGHGADGQLLLIDEILTPDSSRFWPAAGYQPGQGQPSFDKQFVRDYLLGLRDWDRRPPGPELPETIVSGTRERYLEVYARLTGKKLEI